MKPVLLILSVALLGVGEARAATVDADLSRSEGVITDAENHATDLESSLQPGMAFIGRAEAEAQFEENLYQFLVGDFESSATGFFALVASGALHGSDLNRDAEWYLAESLYELGNYGLSESRFAVIAQDEAHPFHDDAVRRLLELYATSGQNEKFKEAYQHYIVEGRVKPSDLITYSIGKAWWRAGDLVQAKSSLSEVQPTSALYMKAQYVLGAVAVREGNLDGAIGYFTNVTTQSIDSPDDRQVLDLSLLALGRIAYERDQFTEAVEWYGKIGGDSEYLDDKLYEIVWVFIKQQDWQQALNGVEIFLLAFPDHEYAARMRLIQGHLHVKQDRHDDALAAYETVIADYTPLKDRFNELADDPTKATGFFQAAAASPTGVPADETLPPYALAMVETDPDLAHALRLYKDLGKEHDTISASEAMIVDLQGVLGNAEHLKIYDHMRGDVAAQRISTLQQRVDLLRLEEEWLYGETPRESRGALDRLQKSRVALTNQITAQGIASGSPAFSDPEVAARLAELQSGYRDARKSVADPDRVGDRFEADDRRLLALDGRLASIQDRIGPVEADQIVKLRDQLGAEVTEVGLQRTDLTTNENNAQVAAAELTQAGFGRLETFFDRSILQADMGIVDVYWFEKVDIADEYEETARSKVELKKEITERFDLARGHLPRDATTSSPSGGTP